MTEEVVVVGAGPAGLHAVLAAAQAGAQVTLVDSYPRPGGQYFKLSSIALGAERRTNHQQQGELLWRQVQGAGVRLLSETIVWGLFEDRLLGLYGPEAPAWMRAEVVILATGAYDRPVAFPGWTLPGVMTTGAVQTLLKSQRVLPGQRIVLAGTGPLQLVTAAALLRAGAEVVAVLEGARLFRAGWQYASALWGQWSRLAEGFSSRLTLLTRGVPYRTGWGIVEAHGEDELTGVTVAQLDDAWRPILETEETLECDTLCLGYGFIPSTELSRLTGAAHEWRPELGGEVPVRDATMQTTIEGIYAVGDGAGIGGASLAMVEGEIAGLAAAERTGHVSSDEVRQAAGRLGPALERERRFQRMYAALFTPGSGLHELMRDDTVICRCEEVTHAEIREAVDRGAESSDEVKAITRCGMGPCQGRVCSHLLAQVVASALDRSVTEIGPLQPRPPIFPVPVESFAESEIV